MFKIQITESAELDMQATYEWWRENRSNEQAESWLNAIYPAIETLKEMPRRCTPLIGDGFPRVEIRQLLFGIGKRPTHRIVFEIDQESIIILRVRHLSQQDLEFI